MAHRSDGKVQPHDLSVCPVKTNPTVTFVRGHADRSQFVIRLIVQFSIGKLLTFIAFIAMFLAVIVYLDFSPKPIRLIKETPPIVKLSATHEQHSYEITVQDHVHTIVVKSPDYPFSVWPMIEWTFDTSDGNVRYINKNYVLGWDRKTLSSEIEINSRNQGGQHFESTDFGNCRVEQHWYEIRKSPTSVTQKIRLYLIENLENRILKQYDLAIETDLELKPNDGH